MLERADANHDGRVTRAEFAAADSVVFNRADANADGKLTADEMSRFAEAVRARR